MENYETLMCSKTTPLVVKVSYKDKNIIRGKVVIGDKFNKIGDIDYWSTSSFIEDEVVLTDGLIQFNKDRIEKSIDKFNTPKHYDNSKGTLYQVATERGWNAYLFDIVKRLERAEKKGEFKTDLEKSKVVIDLWLKESEKL